MFNCIRVGIFYDSDFWRKWSGNPISPEFPKSVTNILCERHLRAEFIEVSAALRDMVRRLVRFVVQIGCNQE